MEMNKKIQKPKLRKRKTRKERDEIIRSRMGLKFLNLKELKLLKDAFKKLDSNESGCTNFSIFCRNNFNYGRLML